MGNEGKLVPAAPAEQAGRRWRFAGADHGRGGRHHWLGSQRQRRLLHTALGGLRNLPPPGAKDCPGSVRPNGKATRFSGLSKFASVPVKRVEKGTASFAVPLKIMFV